MELLGKTYIAPDDRWFQAPYPSIRGMRALVSEGFCPFNHGQLQRELVPGHGWCRTCRVGWKLEGGNLHAELMLESS